MKPFFFHREAEVAISDGREDYKLIVDKCTEDLRTIGRSVCVKMREDIGYNY